MARQAIVITGSTGLVGGLIAATLLQNEQATIVLPIRQKNDPQLLRERLLREAFASDHEAAAAASQRLEIVALPRTAEQSALVPELSRSLQSFDISDVVHAAGCLSYFNAARAAEGNQQLTERWLQVARNVGTPRFVYISTAFASGYVDTVVPETLHEPSGRQDPNEYTRSKRETEWLVASSGLPHLVVRPSIVVGDSRDGRYEGKPFGAYQVWTGMCRFLCDRQRSVIHAVAPRVPFHAIHQDAFQTAFLAGFRSLPAGAVFHVASDWTRLPTLQDCWHLWMLACGRPREVRYYSSLGNLPQQQLDDAERLFIEFSEANIEIATHRWQFETKHLHALRAAGLTFNDLTLASMDRCLARFLEQNAKAQRFLERARGEGTRDWIPSVVQAG